MRLPRAHCPVGAAQQFSFWRRALLWVGLRQIESECASAVWGESDSSGVCVGTVEDLMSTLRSICAGLVDKRRGKKRQFLMGDIGMAALSDVAELRLDPCALMLWVVLLRNCKPISRYSR
jgi:hypothetical protein